MFHWPTSSLRSTPPPSPTHVSSSEIQSAISSFKTNSAPGPSGQSKKFFEFLFRFNRTFFTNAINRLMNIEDFENSNFAWIKKRTIIFIKKKPKSKANKCSDFRPISLLEVLYKILSKLLLEKLNPFMTEIVGSHQFGFTQGRAMSLCSLSTLSTIEYIKEFHPSAAVIFFDIASAFDSVSNDAIETTLKHIFPNSIFPQMIINLSTGGIAKVSVNNFCSGDFNIYAGSGQGDNLSGSKFNIVEHMFKGLFHYLIEKKIPNTRIPLPFPPPCSLPLGPFHQPHT